MKIELVESGKAPERQHDSAAYDCFAREVELTYSPNVSEATGAVIRLGFKLDCDNPMFGIKDLSINFESKAMRTDGFSLNFAALLMPRSGWGSKYGFRLLNTIGLVDPDYRGELIAKVAFDECPPELDDYAESECTGCKPRDCWNCDVVEKGLNVDSPRVCQMLIVPYYAGALEVVGKLDDTVRGDGGFGSSGC